MEPKSLIHFYFYPRPPRGGRPLASASNNCFGIFLSTPSARRATDLIEPEAVERKISIHALREEGDSAWPMSTASNGYFYPRPPRGGRRAEIL